MDRKLEVYEATFDGALHMRECDDRDLLARLDDWQIDPLCGAGDPELMSASIFRFPEGGGSIVVHDETGEKSFVVLCNSNLALAETASHYASLVANLRYGADIFENGDEG
ncbi:MAG: hypothetical protein IIY31_03415 [Desulfovibrio sp.]|jgi:hypothetical protein|nr:hypothetical protein [Desulfovibrio sp.]MBQ1538964.1 hypothetical protein [Desulfovibrio sp.]MBQ1845871.1 hypothetical protein [Desulfovibrio sp.]MBQ2476212.1 hypothetical protein [Desulfovibrio sp.]MBQ2516976.1 hypothetical protein [Desulfovibrio sp.]